MNGKARSVWSCQDEFLPPNRMHLQNEALIFYMENQAIVKWGIPIDLISADDPPVVVSSVEKADIWVPQTDNLSKFAIYMFAFSLQFSFRKSWVCGPAEPEMVQLITSRFPKLEFPDHWWTGDLLYGYDDLIVSISDGRYVHAVALSDDALSTFLKLATDETFEAVASSDN